MKCKAVHNNLIFFLEKELPDSEMKEVREHLNSCPDCALFAEEMKKTFGILEVEKAVEVNPFFYTRVKARLENQEQEQVVGRPLLVRVLQPVTFSILLVLAVYGGIKMGQPYHSATGNDGLNEMQMIPYLNEMDAEPIEAFLME
ncbi:zf-HC2 domain-containing protein [Prolixibacteraceae bacterium Z1-6]|uniref:Zf-HC2 domain-containing protein n=1 Tax=Draconibacterium aestuarii TaxID=2998507 RepID=A0A9X3F8R7_9BACT|nr:zf-HC2 domain-containing protein [Prolixibacteraceae bacterium Z1-6]